MKCSRTVSPCLRSPVSRLSFLPLQQSCSQETLPPNLFFFPLILVWHLSFCPFDSDSFFLHASRVLAVGSLKGQEKFLVLSSQTRACLGKGTAKSIRGKFSLRFCSPDKEWEYVRELPVHCRRPSAQRLLGIQCWK